MSACAVIKHEYLSWLSKHIVFVLSNVSINCVDALTRKWLTKQLSNLAKQIIPLIRANNR